MASQDKRIPFVTTVGQFDKKLRFAVKKELVARALISDVEYYRGITPLKETSSKRADANSMISDAISESLPFMAARLGRGEVRFLSKVLLRKKMGIAQRTFHRILECADLIWTGKDKWFRDQFGGSTKRASHFFSMYLEAMENVDVLGSWSPGEALFENHLRSSAWDELEALEPYNHQVPWSHQLKGKRVLVIHPFARSIESQFQNSRELLFRDPRVLPSFQLRTLIPFMEGIRDPAPRQDLVSQFEIVREEMMLESFDVVIIGSGPIGFLLASEAKKEGQVAIHLGGATQLLFGIRGKRWEQQSVPPDIFNSFWIRPSAGETPPSFDNKYDGGAYW